MPDTKHRRRGGTGVPASEQAQAQVSTMDELVHRPIIFSSPSFLSTPSQIHACGVHLLNHRSFSRLEGGESWRCVNCDVHIERADYQPALVDNVLMACRILGYGRQDADQGLQRRIAENGKTEENGIVKSRLITTPVCGHGAIVSGEYGACTVQHWTI